VFATSHKTRRQNANVLEMSLSGGVRKISAGRKRRMRNLLRKKAMVGTDP